MYYDLLEIIEKEVDIELPKKITKEINDHEKFFCYQDFHKSASLCASKLKEYGITNIEIKHLLADGETTYLDYIIPEAWDIKDASLEIIYPENLPLRILANFKEEPFCVANYCPPTPQEGIEAEIILEEDLQKEENISGKMVFVCAPYESKNIKREVVKKGGTGIIFSPTGTISELIDGTRWINGWSESSGWYPTKEEKRILYFSISPRKGEYLKELITKNKVVKVKAKVNSRIYNGSIDTITGIIPGKEKKEILLLAHLYEPMPNDNALGAAAALEILRILKTLIDKGIITTPKYGIRVLFSMERYGFAEFFQEKIKREKIICAINLDSIAFDHKISNVPHLLRINPASQPFFGDFLLQDMMESYFSKKLPLHPWQIEKGNFSDDTFIADPTIDIPINWLSGLEGLYHHNSLNNFQKIDWESAKIKITIIASYVYFLASVNEKKILYLANLVSTYSKKKIIEEGQKLLTELLKEKNLNYYQMKNNIEERLKFISNWQKGRIKSLKKIGCKEKYLKTLIKEIDVLMTKEVNKILNNISKVVTLEKKRIRLELSRKEKFIQNMVPKRLTIGFPFSLSKVLFQDRMPIPSYMEMILSWIDGKKDVLEILKLVEQETNMKFIPGKISEVVKYLTYLEKYGYIKINYKFKLTKEDIISGLKKLGIGPRDKIMVHTSLSSLGYVEGGAETVCRALMELVTPEGVVMMPGFNHGAPFEKNGPGYFSPIETPTTNGEVPEKFRHLEGVYRSLDPTHSVSVWGKDAIKYVENHHKVLTMGKGSPIQLLEEADGKVILIDCPSANTFHHVVEMTNNVPCLGKRTEEYPVKLPDGSFVKLRTWGWRNGACPITDKGVYLNIMKRKGFIKKGKIGNATVLVFRMKDCRKVIEKLLKNGIKGFSGCKTCNIRPRVTPYTVESDWDEKNQQPKAPINLVYPFDTR